MHLLLSLIKHEIQILVHKEAVIFYKIFRSKLPSHINALISNLTMLSISRNSPSRLKSNWCCDLLND